MTKSSVSPSRRTRGVAAHELLPVREISRQDLLNITSAAEHRRRQHLGSLVRRLCLRGTRTGSDRSSERRAIAERTS